MDLAALLESSGAILRGHFLLTSGRHSEVYFEKFRVLERPDVLSALCAEIAGAFGAPPPLLTDSGGIVGPNPPSLEEIEAYHRRVAAVPHIVAGPTTGGIIIAFEVARQLGLPALYVETDGGEKVLRRGATVPDGARVLIVDDVLTTGRSVFETAAAIRSRGGEVCGVAVLIDRSERPVDFGVPCFAAYRVEAKSYAPEEVPDWLAAQPIQKPGTRRDA